MNHHIFSEYGFQSVQPSPVNQMMSEFAKDFRPGVDINLGVGYVNEDTIPYEEFGKIASEIVQKERRPSHLLNYGGPEGSKELIETIKNYYKDLWENGCIGEIPDFNERDIIIGVSGATSILTGLANVLRKGIVITTDPLYYIYTSTLERYGFEIVPILEEKEGPTLYILEETIETYLKQGVPISFCYFVTVNNPTCTIITNRRRKEIIECVQGLTRKYNVFIPIIFDLAYEWLIHDPEMEKPVSPSVYDAEGSVFEIGTLSKVFAPSLRIGFIIGRRGNPILKALVQWNSDVGFSAPLITQEVSAELIKRKGLYQFQSVNNGYRKKGTMLKRCFMEKMGQYIEFISGGSAGFYLYLTLKGIRTEQGSTLFNLLSRRTGDKNWDWDSKGNCLKPRVIYLPGAYCVHHKGSLCERGKFQLRVSYGYESIENLMRSVDIFTMAIERARRMK